MSALVEIIGRIIIYFLSLFGSSEQAKQIGSLEKENDILKSKINSIKTRPHTDADVHDLLRERAKRASAIERTNKSKL